MEKKYIYVNVKIPLEITEDTYEYKLLRKYADVTFQNCEENPQLREPTNHLKESMIEKIKQLLIPTSDSKVKENPEECVISPQTIAEILSILPNEIKKKLPSKNISFKQKPRILSKRTTSKVYRSSNINEKEDVDLLQYSEVQEQIKEDDQ
jgi:hypothetical protein